MPDRQPGRDPYAGLAAGDPRDHHAQERLTPITVQRSGQPGQKFLKALPELTRAIEELHRLLGPAMTQDPEADRAYAETAWMLCKALDSLRRAAETSDRTGSDMWIGDAADSAQTAAGHARGIRAATSDTGQLAAAGLHARLAESEFNGGYMAFAATVDILIPYRGQDEVEISLPADGGRASLVSKRAYTRRNNGVLSVGGRTQLDIAAALDLLTTAFIRARSCAS